MQKNIIVLLNVLLNIYFNLSRSECISEYTIIRLTPAYLQIGFHLWRYDHLLRCGHFVVNLLNEYPSSDCIGYRFQRGSLFRFFDNLGENTIKNISSYIDI